MRSGCNNFPTSTWFEYLAPWLEAQFRNVYRYWSLPGEWSPGHTLKLCSLAPFLSLLFYLTDYTSNTTNCSFSCSQALHSRVNHEPNFSNKQTTTKKIILPLVELLAKVFCQSDGRKQLIFFSTLTFI